MDRTVFENIMLPLEVVGIKIEEASQKAEDVLAQVGLLEHKEKFPIQLSRGEMQRAAIARALVLSPDIILADEATGNLDMATSWEIIKLLSDINEKGTTVVMATHNLDIVKNLSKRVIELEKGRITKDSKSPKSEQKKNGDKEEQKKDKKEEEKPVDKDKDKEDKLEKKKEDKK